MHVGEWDAMRRAPEEVPRNSAPQFCTTIVDPVGWVWVGSTDWDGMGRNGEHELGAHMD